MIPIDINIVYDEIIEKLKTFNNPGIITELEKSAAGAATGSEGLMNQGSYLINLRYNNPSVFSLIEEQIGLYLKYCKQQGLSIR